MTEQTQGIDPASAATNPPPASSPDGQPPANGGATSAPAVTDPNAASEANGVQKRIDELTRQRYDAERRADHWQRLASSQPQQTPQPAAPEQPKSLADFDYDEAKFKAYLFETAESRAVTAAEKRLKEQAQRDNESRRQSEFRARAEKFAETAKDFNEVVYGSRLVTDEMAGLSHVIVAREEGPALAYHLAKNPQIADQLARLPQLEAAVELGRIEAKLVAEREKAKAATPVVSQAPPPAPKIEAAEPAVSKDPSEMTDAEFAKWRKRQIAQRR